MAGFEVSTNGRFCPVHRGHVLTYGFPAPIIQSANVDQQGNWAGGNLLLKAHANEGIVSAQYEFNNQAVYELNVAWHHGESGEPIFSLDHGAVFAMMQFYRNIQSPHGTVAGPHVWRAVSLFQSALQSHGAAIV
jgi:hypothetical protein